MKNRFGLYLSTVSSCLMLSACGWVDSTGSQSQAVSVTQVYLDDQLFDGPESMQEQELAEIHVIRESTTLLDKTFSWSEPLEQGNLASCANIDGFNPELAASTLAEACTDATQCSLNFEQREITDEVLADEATTSIADFDLLIPQLQASIGLRYELTITEAETRRTTSEYEFCLIAVNEAPIAVNDTFVVLEGERKVFSADEVNLLSNDSDDVDVSNVDIHVLPELLEEPGKAAVFELEEDGSFVYESSLSGIVTDQFDTFDYQVTDGVHVSTATATIRIVAANQAPELIDDIPDLEATEGVPFVENLGLYFVDPEQADLSYEFSEDTELPDDGTLSLSEDGVLSGIPDEDDVGTSVLTLIVSDGGATVEATVTLIIEPAPVVVENSAPEYIAGTVISRTVDLGDEMTPIVPVFFDEDDDILTYAIIGSSDLPDGVEIDEDTGVVSGTPEEVTNVRNLRIEATDPSGESAVSGFFSIRVR